jgi:beta-glucosidase-like glycosyl hydrolase/VanZ family protein
MQVGEDPR